MDGSINIFMNIMRETFSFKGRINRRQYWLFLLVLFLIFFVLAWFTQKLGGIPLWQIYAVVMILPYISASVKRLHDVNKSGLWIISILVPIFGLIYLFVLTIENGFEGKNGYGVCEDWSLSGKGKKH